MRIQLNPVFLRAFFAARAAACATVIFASALLVCVSLCAQETQMEGQTVAEVRVLDESGKTVSAPIPPLPLQAGKPFDFSEERESLRKLYFTGDYADLRVTA